MGKNPSEVRHGTNTAVMQPWQTYGTTWRTGTGWLSTPFCTEEEITEQATLMLCSEGI